MREKHALYGPNSMKYDRAMKVYRHCTRMAVACFDKKNDNRLDAVGCLKPSSFSSPRWRKGPAALPAPAGGDTAMCQVATIFCLLQKFEMIWIYVI